MDHIQALLRIARRRLEMTAFLNRTHQVAIAAAGVVLVLMVIDKIPADEFLAWNWILPGVIGVSLAVACLLWVRRRRTDLQVAMNVWT